MLKSTLLNTDIEFSNVHLFLILLNYSVVNVTRLDQLCQVTSEPTQANLALARLNEIRDGLAHLS